MSEIKKRPLIIDCDPGTDDAICIFMVLAQEQFDVLGICPVNGNKPLAVCEKNALQLLELAGREDIPVLKGANKGMFREQRDAGDIHGAGGLGKAVLPDPRKQLEDEYAWDFLYRKAVECGGELEVLAVGPLTNIAIALTKYPDLKNLIKNMVIMGGVAGGVGNHGTVPAEFNIWVDPEAAKIVFKSGIPMAMMGLDICVNMYVKDEAVEKMRAGGKVSKAASQMVGGYIEGDRNLVICDATAACYLIDPSIVNTEYVHVDVETKGKLTEGKTVITRHWTEHLKYAPNCYVGIDGDIDRFTDLIVASLAKLDENVK